MLTKSLSKLEFIEAIHKTFTPLQASLIAQALNAISNGIERGDLEDFTDAIPLKHIPDFAKLETIFNIVVETSTDEILANG